MCMLWFACIDMFACSVLHVACVRAETMLDSLSDDAALWEIAKHGDSIGQHRLQAIVTSQRQIIDNKDKQV